MVSSSGVKELVSFLKLFFSDDQNMFLVLGIVVFWRDLYPLIIFKIAKQFFKKRTAQKRIITIRSWEQYGRYEYVNDA